MNQRWKTWATLAAGFLAGACTEEPLDPADVSQVLVEEPSQNSRINRSDTTTLSGVGGSGADDVAMPQYDLVLSLSGALKPGVPFTIRAQLVGRIQSDDVQLRLLAPEAQMSQRGLAVVPESFDAVDVWQGRLSRGNSVTRVAEMLIQQPGYYRLMAYAQDLGEHRSDSLLIERVAFEEIWVYLDEAGGFVTQEYDTTAFRHSEHKAPGPRRDKGAVGHSNQLLDASAAGAPCVTGTVTYLDVSSQPQPVPNAEVAVGFASPSGTTVTQTDANGVYTICGQVGQSVTATVRTVHDDFAIYNGDGATLPLLLGTISETLTSSIIVRDIVATDTDAAKLFADFDYTVERSRTTMGHSRGDMDIFLSSSTGSNYYSGYYDHIVFRRQTVPTDNGIVIAAHEYGHALHETALDDINGSGTSNTCPSPHYINGAYNMHCAYTEGFADFHGALVTGPVVSDASFGDWKLEQNNSTWYWQLQTGGPYTPYGDGSLVEEAFAAFLYDLVDGPTSPNGVNNTATGTDDDSLALSGQYVADVIRTCRVYVTPLGWRDAEYVDEFVWCFQRQVDRQVPFFASRTSEFASSFSESAVEGSAGRRSGLRICGNWTSTESQWARF